MTRYSSSRGMLYTAPPKDETDDAATEEAAETATADD
jgi:hypothetical protein